VIYRLIVWTFTWNLRFHFSLLLHWKNRSEKYTVYYFPVFFFVPVRHFEWPSFGYQKFGSLVVVNFWVLISFSLVGFFRPPFCNSDVVICHRLWAVWKWLSSLKKSTSLLIGFWLAEWFRPCRTICPRRDRRGRSHLHPQLQPIHREAWYSHPWGFHLP